MESTVGLRIVVVTVLLIGFAGALSQWVMSRPDGDWKGLTLNLVTEMAGAAVMYLLFEIVIGLTQKREAEKKELAAKKADIIAQMGSSVKDVAVAAAEALERHGWLDDGSLQWADLAWADLAWANLEGANLQWADLAWANLEGANLQRANLQGAALDGANLQGAALDGANLDGANLAWADLEGAVLAWANLEGAEFNDYTTLPDGAEWTPDTDMTRFTDSKHPDFRWPDA